LINRNFEKYYADNQWMQETGGEEADNTLQAVL